MEDMTIKVSPTPDDKYTPFQANGRQGFGKVSRELTTYGSSLDMLWMIDSLFLPA
jgi:hypothetical protein